MEDRYDELTIIVEGLNNIINNIQDKSYIAELEDTKYRVEDELEEVEKKLQEQWEKEALEEELEYRRGVL